MRSARCAYMSPEQLRGEELDGRTDLFSLGLVLYEMATGRAAFAGATSAVISAAILHTTPLKPRAIRPELPAGLESVILKAIEKDRHLRYQHASDIRVDLQRLKAGHRSRRPRRRLNRLLKYGIVAVAALILVAGGLFCEAAAHASRTAHGQRCAGARRLRQYHRRSCFRRDAAPGAGHPA